MTISLFNTPPVEVLASAIELSAPYAPPAHPWRSGPHRCSWSRWNCPRPLPARSRRPASTGARTPSSCSPHRHAPRRSRRNSPRGCTRRRRYRRRSSRSRRHRPCWRRAANEQVAAGAADVERGRARDDGVRPGPAVDRVGGAATDELARRAADHAHPVAARRAGAVGEDRPRWRRCRRSARPSSPCRPTHRLAGARRRHRVAVAGEAEHRARGRIGHRAGRTRHRRRGNPPAPCRRHRNKSGRR